jgi:purine-binding chemotaxis protein CheW
MNDRSDNILQLVTFVLNGEEYGIDILTVQEILRMVEITGIPRSPEFIDGVINLRGRVIPVVNLRKKFGLGGESKGIEKIMVVNVNDLTAGIVVDSVSEVLRLKESNVEEAPAMVTGGNTEYIKGVGKLEDRLVILIDVEKLVSNEELHLAV